MRKLVVSRDDSRHMCQQEEEEIPSVATLAAETCGTFQTDNFCVGWICDGRAFSFLCRCCAHCVLFLPKIVCAKSENYHPSDITWTVWYK